MVSRKGTTARKDEAAPVVSEPRADRYHFMQGGTISIMLKTGLCVRGHVGADNKVRLPLRWVIDQLGIEEIDGNIRQILESEPDERVAYSKVFEVWRGAVEKFNDSLKEKAGYAARVVHAEDGQALLCHGCLAIIARG